ncbi:MULTISPECIES: hypothetical protein [Reichenbachiella]|uniref:Uncharacterized protein n=1 Tax=Reichenbachiella agariperforans TaxID=156994 RepID=A0A1M6Q240_REIAG|nr:MULTISPECIES: hypothetical protein [Reichenbachiella]RJE72926.1 hypothetical protein BGP76_02970 [Reichenbachiella sp. MSK19-1]SHK14191.1 hypothetical protein SAMN04488028_103139 [Reichenbachiella agariperforans]
MKTNKFISFLKKPVVVLGIAATAMLGACENKGEDILDPILPEPDGQALNESFTEQLNERKETFAFDVAEGGSWSSKSGTSTLSIPAEGLVDANGEPVTGSVDVTFIEIFGRADMLLGNKPTMGQMGDGTRATLISGGEFYIEVKQDGEAVFMKENMGYQLQVKTDSLDMDMRIFGNANEDCETADCDVVWEEEKNRGLEAVGQGADGTGGGQHAGTYYAFLNDFGWTNLDKWYSSDLPKTTVFVDVPEGYDDTNCAVYLSYDGEPAALARFDTYFPEDELFSEHYGMMPIGIDVHFIVVSIVDDEYHYAIQSATTTEDHVEVVDALMPTTESELTQLINDLP